MGKFKTDVVIISYNTQKHTIECIESLNKHDNKNINEIIVVDNASTDGTVNALKNLETNLKIIVNKENLGYAKAVNIGVSASNSDYVIISNSDVIYHKNSIEKLISYLINNDDVAVTGPLQLYPDGSFQYSYGDLPGFELGLKKLFFFNHIHDYLKKFKLKKGIKKIIQVNYVDGAVMAVKRKAFDDVNGFDEDYFFYTEEADFCYRLMKNGWKISHHPDSIVTHYRGATDKSNGLNNKRLSQMISSKIKFCKKHITFQETKFYIICEIVYSLNMSVLWFLLSKFKKNELQADGKNVNDKNDFQKSKFKFEYNKLLYHIWLDEFNDFLKSYEK